MRAGVMVSVVLVLAGACRSPAAPSDPGQGAPSNPGPITTPRRLLVVTHTTGFRHSSISVAESVLSRLADDTRVFTVTFCRDAADVTRLLTPAAQSGIDGVFFVNTTGDLGLPDLPGFLVWIRAGHAFLGAHSASDTYHNEPGYLAMLGAEFDTHGDQATVDIRVEDRAHPATSMLPSPWRVHDEIYEFRSNPRPRVNVLLSLDRHPNDGHPQAGQPGDFPLSWHHTFGAGRVFYTALGHREDVWTNPQFQQHLVGALRWSLNGS